MQKSLSTSTNRKFYLLPALLLPLLAVGSYSQTASAQTFTTLVNFIGSNGQNPTTALVQGTDGNFYGTTSQAGSACYPLVIIGCGTVFKMTPDGTLTTLVNFDYTNGSLPSALVQGTDGNFYGTTLAGGTDGDGTVFKMTPFGTLTTLVNFDYDPSIKGGVSPFGVVQGSDGNFYGTNNAGGLYEAGTVFKMTPFGTLITLVNFNGSNGSGGYPQAGVVEGSDGNFYGTTSGARVYQSTVFRMTPSGTLTTLAILVNGTFPTAELVQGTDGNFYGTTFYGGSGTFCNNPYGCGTVFKITPSGTLTTLVNFDTTNGAYPDAALVQGSDGNFYGTTSGGGSVGGTIFRMTPDGILTTLVSFDSDNYSTKGGRPNTLVQGTDGNFYGTTNSGGTFAYGTVFVLNTSPTTLTSFSPTSATGGATVIINGTNFTAPNTSTLTSGITAVQFNGVNATSYTVKSSTQITAVVPVDATTGPITLTTNTGAVVTSSTSLKALPKVNSFSPTSGIANTSVAITGTNLLGTTSVKFNNTAAPSFTVISATQIAATVPSTATSGPIRVTTPGGTSSSTTNFRVLPKINSFTPTSGPVGTVVTLTGSGFKGATSVQFNGVAAGFRVSSATKINAQVPVGATTGQITVTTPTGSSTSTNSFTVQ